MCEIGAVCPNCGQRNLDGDESSCITLEGMAYREYRCSRCTATITVTAPSGLPRPVRARRTHLQTDASPWGRWRAGGGVTATLPGDEEAP
jgi:DNA-directed RNA polymerase subunit RPC12/RpoP